MIFGPFLHIIPFPMNSFNCLTQMALVTSRNRPICCHDLEFYLVRSMSANRPHTGHLSFLNDCHVACGQHHLCPDLQDLLNCGCLISLRLLNADEASWLSVKRSCRSVALLEELFGYFIRRCAELDWTLVWVCSWKLIWLSTGRCWIVAPWSYCAWLSLLHLPPSHLIAARLW